MTIDERFGKSNYRERDEIMPVKRK